MQSWQLRISGTFLVFIVLSSYAGAQQLGDCRSYASWKSRADTHDLVGVEPGNSTTFFQYPAPNQWAARNAAAGDIIGFFQDFKVHPGKISLRWDIDVQGKYSAGTDMKGRAQFVARLFANNIKHKEQRINDLPKRLIGDSWVAG